MIRNFAPANYLMKSSEVQYQKKENIMSEQIEQQNNKATEAPVSAANESAAAFQVVNEGFSTREAIEEAKRCLHC